MANESNLPGRGLFGWLGRQVGHVAKAVKTDVTATPPSKAVYRDVTVVEQPLPGSPGVTLRRTVIDEAIIKAAESSERKAQSEDQA